MTRTIRRWPHKYGVSALEAERLLRTRQKDRPWGRWVRTFGRWVYDNRYGSRLYFEPAGQYRPIPARYNSPWSGEPYTYETYHDIWEPAPGIEDGEREEYRDFWEVHHWVYRNGSCYRQRMHAKAKWKRAERKSRRERERKQTRELLLDVWVSSDTV